MSDGSRFNSPAELVAIANAAHIAGDAPLERAAKRELLEHFDIRLSFGRERRTAAADIESGVTR
jgi:hypothetical protein